MLCQSPLAYLQNNETRLIAIGEKIKTDESGRTKNWNARVTAASRASSSNGICRKGVQKVKCLRSRQGSFITYYGILKTEGGEKGKSAPWD